VYGLRVIDGTFVFASTSFAYPGPGEVFYETENCTGQGFWNGGVSTPSLTGGFVFEDRVGARYYSPKSAVSTNRIRAAYIDAVLGCTDDAGNPQVPAIPVLPNNSDVTGVPDSPIPGPLTIGQAVVPRAMLRDGFENPQASLVRASATGIA